MEYAGCTYDMSITVLKRGQPGEIRINPTHTYYDAGDMLIPADLTDLVVTVHYPDGSTPQKRHLEIQTIHSILILLQK